MNLSSQTIGMIRAGMAILAAMFESGYIPTKVDGGGHTVAAALIAAALYLQAGDRTPTNLLEASADIDAAKRAVAVPVTITPPPAS